MCFSPEAGSNPWHHTFAPQFRHSSAADQMQINMPAGIYALPVDMVSAEFMRLGKCKGICPLL